MKRLVTSCILALFIIAGTSYSNGLNLNSIGVKAASMGGAFVGLADDYSAVFWNPAGISQIENVQIAGYFTGVMPTGTYKTKFDPAGINVDATTESQMFPVPGIMGYVPIVSGSVNLGLGVYIPSGLGATWKGEELQSLSGNIPYEWMSEIGVINLAPSVSFQLMPNLSIGAAVNISYGFLDLKQPREMPNPQTGQEELGQYSESSSGWGLGATFGILYQPIDMLSLGFAMKTSNNIGFEGTANHTLYAAIGEGTIKRDIAWPMWMGGGVAVKLLSSLTVTADVQYTNWATLDYIYTDLTGWGPNPVQDTMMLLWEDRMQFRIGAEFEVLSTLALRAGFYLDPAPAPDETLNILFPSIDYMGPTFGAALKVWGITLEGGFEYLMGTERTIPDSEWANPDIHNMPGTHNNDIFAFFVGFVWDF